MAAFLANERNFQIVAGIALATQQCESIEELNRVITEVVVEQSADKARLYVPNLNALGVNKDHIAFAEYTVLADTTRQRVTAIQKTLCEPVRRSVYEELLGEIDNEVGSIALVPVRYQNIEAVLVVGDQSADFFTPDAGTIYLDFLGATLARTMYRLARTVDVGAEQKAAVA